MDGELDDYRRDCDKFPLVTFYTRFDYDDCAGEIIRQIKYRERRSLLDVVAPPVAELAGALAERYSLDLLLPVPLHRRKERERGFNQSALIAESVAAESGIRCQVRTMERAKYTKQQTRLKGGKRLANVSGAFAVCDAAAVAGKRVLLLDDVITTGATAAHCVYALWAAGAEIVVVIGVAGADR
jgi:ComF family protein